MSQTKRVFISTFPFGVTDDKPLALLREAGIEYTLNPFGRKLSPQETAEHAKDFPAVIAGTENLLPLIESSNSLRMISRVGIGLDSVPWELCKERGLKVSFTPDAVTPAVTELTVGLMLDCLRGVAQCDRQIRDGVWTRPVGRRIAESKIGIVGFGRVGRGVFKLLESFHPQHIYLNDIRDIPPPASPVPTSVVELPELLRESDIVTLHIPHYGKTDRLFNKELFGLMKPDSILINTARGTIIDESDLHQALTDGSLFWAALDVFTKEPYHGPLSQLDNVTLTQHIGSCTVDCRLAMEMEAAEEIVGYFAGREQLRPVRDEDVYR